MKRLWAAVIILIVLLAGSLWNAWYAGELANGLAWQLGQAQELAAQGDLVFGIQTLTQDAEHLRAIAQIRSQFHVTLE